MSLEIPLRPLDVGWLRDRDHAGSTGMEMLDESLDRPALTGSIATFEDDEHLLTGFLDPQLQLEQLDLQTPLLPLVLAARHLLLVRIALLPGIRELRRL